jgi:hypothetical protein
VVAAVELLLRRLVLRAVVVRAAPGRTARDLVPVDRCPRARYAQQAMYAVGVAEVRRVPHRDRSSFRTPMARQAAGLGTRPRPMFSLLNANESQPE